MTKLKSLVSGIGNSQEITKYYDNWSKDYDKTLNYWKYTAPSKSILTESVVVSVSTPALISNSP